jgi:hypothetical protein
MAETSTATERQAKRRPAKRSITRPPDGMGDGHPSPPGSDVMGDSLYEPGEPRPPSPMGDGHPSPPGSDVMGNSLYEPGEPRPPGPMGDGHPSPPGSDVMGNSLYESEAEAETDPDMR